jgi:hypothetical protein
VERRPAPLESGDDLTRLLLDRVLPQRANRRFYCGAFDPDTGEIREVRTWRETGCGTIHHDECFTPSPIDHHAWAQSRRPIDMMG